MVREENSRHGHVAAMKQHPPGEATKGGPRVLCALPDCRPVLGTHTTTCTDDRCRGCYPKLAEDGLQVCTSCRYRATDRVTELRHLYTALLTPTRTHAGGGRQADPDDDNAPATLAEVASPGSDGALGARHLIRDYLIRWTNTLVGMGHPHPGQADLAHYVAGNALYLLADPTEAPPFAADTNTVHDTARRNAYPSAPAGQALGECPDCGTVVRANTGTDLHVTCRGCGTSRTIPGWQAVLVGDLSKEATAIGPDLAAYLSALHQRAITLTTIRHWSNRGARITVQGKGKLHRIERLGTDTASRALYSIADATYIAEALYGKANP
jgi:hypothetical protein